MNKYVLFTLAICSVICSCSSDTDKKDEQTYTYSYPFGGPVEYADTIVSTQPASKAKVLGVSDIYQEGFDVGYGDGEDDFLDKCGYEGNYNDDCNYSGWKRREYVRGYASGYEEGYADAKGDDGSDDPEGDCHVDE